MRFAWVTMCLQYTPNNVAFMDDCLASIGSLMVTSLVPQVDVVAMLDGLAMRSVGDALRARGVRVIHLGDVDTTRGSDWGTIRRRQRKGLHMPYEVTALQKLRVFTLTRYERVLYFDPDVLFVRNASHMLLDSSPFAAVVLPNSTWGCRSRDYLNAEVMLLRPSTSVYAELVEKFYRGDFRDCGGSGGTLDAQDIVRDAAIEPGGALAPVTRWPLCFNYRGWSWQRHCTQVALIHARRLWPATIAVNQRRVSTTELVRALKTRALTFDFPYLIYERFWDDDAVARAKAEARRMSVHCHEHGEGGDNRTFVAGGRRQLGSRAIRQFMNDLTLHARAAAHLDQTSFSVDTLIATVGVGESSGGGWHVDARRRGVKALMYLDDVTHASGPFTMLLNYHNPTPNADRRRTRFSDDEIRRQLNHGASVRTFAAPAGTVIMFETSHVHRGAPLRHGVRTSITNYYANHHRPSPCAWRPF